MSPTHCPSPRPGGVLPPGRLRSLWAAILSFRNEYANRGDDASYSLTARAAELAVADELLALPRDEQMAYAAWLADEGAACLLSAYPAPNTINDERNLHD